MGNYEKIVVTVMLSLFFGGNVFAQKKIDSLKSVWVNEKLQDTSRLKAINVLITDYYLYPKTDSALLLAKKMLEFSKIKQELEFEIKSQTLLGEIYFEKEENDKATKNYEKGLELAQTIDDNLLYAQKLYALGEIYRTHGDYVNAFKTYKKSRKIYKLVGDSIGEVWSIDRLGLVHSAFENFEEAEKYYLENVRLSTRYGVKYSLVEAHYNLGEFYHLKGYILRSIFHWNEGIKIAEEIGEPIKVAKGTSNLITIYINEKDYESASKYLEEYISVVGHLEDPYFKRNILLFKCQINYGHGSYSKALRECEDGLRIMNINNFEVYRPELYESLYKINKKLNRHATALSYLEKYQVIIDDEKEDKARTEIQNIVFNNPLVSDRIAQIQEEERINAALQQELSNTRYFLIALLALLLIIAYFVIFRIKAASKRKRLQEIYQLKTALFTNITHEFRTPLTVIKGMTDTIKTNVANQQHENLENSLNMIERNSDNLLHLVNEMLDLSKIESGNMKLQLVQSDIIPFLKYLSESFHSMAKAAQIELVFYSEIDELVMDFDANKMTAVISNLMSNAIKFTQSGGKIIVHLNKISKKGNDHIFIRVKDDGLGISEDALPHIFDRFYQADASASRKGEGTGIGLALTKEFTELMGGTIVVKSAVGRGSEFNIQIPITKNAPKTIEVCPSTVPTLYDAAEIHIPFEEALESDTQLPLLLIIEDNADVAHYLRTCLKGRYKILHAADGITGIETALEKVPDIIICDVMMPDKDGYEVCITLKSDERTDHIPIIILTAKVTQQDRITGISHGADAYLAKPFDKIELFTRLDQLIQLRKKMMQKFEKEGFGQFLKVRAENPEAKFLKKAVKIIHEEMGNHSFGSRHLARQLSMSESQIYRKLKAVTGKSTAIFIRSVRLQKAKELIQTTDSNISEVAYDVGFNDPSWFSRAFKEEFGFSPSEINR